MSDERACPACAEPIKTTAKKCNPWGERPAPIEEFEIAGEGD